MSQKSSTFAIVIEIERHIEILLLSNDCVIVPGLGGFMTHHIESRYDENEAMFLPPQRTLGFNPQLKLNDSLLAQSYIEAYDISYPEALNRIEDEVCELRQHLENEGYYELNDIGRLSINDEGKLEFDPCEAGILTPGLYGLSSFEMKLLNAASSKTAEKASVLEMETVDVTDNQPQDEESTIETDTNVEEQTDNEEKKERSITIKMSWVRNTVAAAAALLAFFIFTPQVDNDEQTMVNISQLNLPIMTTDSNKKSTATLDEQQVKEVLQQRDMETFDIAAITGPKEEIAQTMETTEPTATTEPAATLPPAARYCIVLASQVSQVNADEFVGRLKKQGYIDARVYLNNKIRRVVCGSFQTADEAYKELRKVHKNKELAEAWVYKVNG